METDTGATGATDPWSEFAVAIFRMNGLIMQAGEGISAQLGQSSARWQVLGGAFRPQTVAEMARSIGYARQSVQRVADALAGEGLVRYTAHPYDRRTKLVELTPSGLEILQAIYARQLEWSGSVLASIDPVVLETATTALGEIAEAVDSVGRANQVQRSRGTTG
jgi:DNA-binding MarR family transcriptional regulator